MMDRFDFNAPAEVFSGTGRGASRRRMTYHRFSNGAEAILEALAGTVIEVSESRFDAAEIRTLYERPEYSEAQESKAFGAKR
jgi:hypothetical protein